MWPGVWMVPLSLAAIVIFLLAYVVPQIVSVFANTKQKLPLLTVIMLAISDFVRSYGWIVALVLVGAYLVWRNALKNPAVKYRWHSWLLTAPLYAFQPPPEPQEGFVPASSLPPGEQMPAAPFLIGSYSFFLLLMMFYLWTIWRRINRVEKEIRDLERRQGVANR